MTNEAKPRHRKRVSVLTGLFVVGFAAASCGTQTTIDTNAEAEVASTSPEATVAGPTDDTLPGFNALRSKGCDAPPPETTVSGLWTLWEPISDVVGLSNVVVEGTIASISGPRVSTLDSDPSGSGPQQLYFRVMTINVEDGSALMADSNNKLGAAVDVLVFGAGPAAEADELCYGYDGMQDNREPALSVGDEVFVLGDFGMFPMAGADEPLVFLPSGVSSLWRVDPDGSTVSATHGYGLEVDELRVRISDEFAAAESGIPVSVKDSLSVQPEQPDAEVQDPIPTPAPPGIDAEETPTVEPLVED